MPDAELPPYRPSLLWRGGHLQTIRTELFAPKVDLDRGSSGRLRLDLDDGSGDQIVVHWSEPAGGREERPLTALRCGYEDVDAFYRDHAALPRLASIPVPVLLVHAGDDPIVPSDPYRGYDFAAQKLLEARLPATGGHVGFHARDHAAPWHARCIARRVAQLGADA